jgi:hypothetical protein
MTKEYFEALRHVVCEWGRDPIEDEWLFESFRDEYVASMNPPDAFEVIGPTTLLLLDQSDESTATEILQTILALANRSDTTEVPVEIRENKNELIEKFSAFGDYSKNKLTELFSRYRIQS